MRCRMTASLRATATLARRMLPRLAMRKPQAFRADQELRPQSSVLAAFCGERLLPEKVRVQVSSVRPRRKSTISRCVRGADGFVEPSSYF